MVRMQLACSTLTISSEQQCTNLLCSHADNNPAAAPIHPNARNAQARVSSKTNVFTGVEGTVVECVRAVASLLLVFCSIDRSVARVIIQLTCNSIQNAATLPAFRL